MTEIDTCYDCSIGRSAQEHGIESTGRRLNTPRRCEIGDHMVEYGVLFVVKVDSHPSYWWEEAPDLEGVPDHDDADEIKALLEGVPDYDAAV